QGATHGEEFVLTASPGSNSVRAAREPDCALEHRKARRRAVDSSLLGWRRIPGLHPIGCATRHEYDLCARIVPHRNARSRPGASRRTAVLAHATGLVGETGCPGATAGRSRA